MSDDSKQNDSPLATQGEASLPVAVEFSRIQKMLVLALVIFVILLFVFFRPVKLDVYKTADEVVFADAALRSCVQNTVEQHKWSTIGQIVSLRCNNPGGEAIHSLAGIEHLVELSDVNFAFNAITEADPLGQLPLLKVVDLSHNQLATVPRFRARSNLKRLDLNYNLLTSLEWLRNEEFVVLDNLSVAHNQISSTAGLESVSGLRELNMRGNRISELGSVGTLTRLEFLDAGGNRLRAVPELRGLSALVRLFLDHNLLRSSDELVTLQSLEELNLGSNPLQDLSGLEALQRLQRLNLSGTSIDTLQEILALGDITVLHIELNDALPCSEVAKAFREYGPEAVIHDARCSPE